MVFQRVSACHFLVLSNAMIVFKFYQQPRLMLATLGCLSGVNMG
ncbi:unnamed protein product [Linum tenue]|uniref:Uncharacterized protein n=1 Tax=Linum tenue TaxID=586396 RepID=A0AAV0S636_9ROSI|nr:unnamed protein product [Linum tenue]